MNDNSQNTRAVVLILIVLGGMALAVCSGIGLIGYTYLSRYEETQKAEAEAVVRNAEAAEQAASDHERNFPQ